MKRGGLIALVVIVVLLVMGGGCVTSNYNRLVTTNETVKNAWAEVDNQLKARNDKLGNLVETVKGTAGQEQVVFGQIADARAAMAGARSPEEGIKAAQTMDNALGRLLVVVENYPQLKSNEAFTQLMDEISGIENRLAVARMRYNDQVKLFNVLVKQFPMNLFAGMFGFKEAPYYPVPDVEKQLPKVDFSDIRKPATK